MYQVKEWFTNSFRGVTWLEKNYFCRDCATWVNTIIPDIARKVFAKEFYSLAP